MNKMMLDFEESEKYVGLGILCYNENGSKVYYKLETLEIEESVGDTKLTHKLVPLTASELKEIGIEESQSQPLSEIDVEESQSQPVSEGKKANLTLSGDENAVRAARKILEANMGSAKPVMSEREQEQAEEIEDLKNRLGIIAEREGEKKRKTVAEKVNALVVDPEKRAQFLEQVKTDKLDNVSALDKTMDILSDQLKKAKNERYETPAGSPLVPQQYGGSQDSIWTRKFSNGEQMVKALEAVANDKSNPDSKKAVMALQQIWQKNIAEWKAGNKTGQLIPSRDDAIPKREGDVEMQENALGEDQFESETHRIVGPSFKPAIHNYSKTHSRIISQQGNGE